MAQKTTKRTKEKKENGRGNLAGEVKVRFEKISDDFMEFQEVQRKKMEEFIDGYVTRLQKLREEVETKTSDSFSQLASHLRFATRDDIDEVLKKLASIERKVQKISKGMR